jgi:NAD(P)-dependent dehydrogenase (short-subunit alcohol dehydrogenase family)
MKRMAKPEEIAHAVLFLVLPGSEYITGQNITVDGGLSALHPGFVETATS